MPTAFLRLLVPVVVVTLLGTGVPDALTGMASAAVGPDHLVISEVVTGGASASDELVELYNPTSAPLPLEGLEVVYVTATGLTVSRRAAWELGGPDIPPGGHLLVANEAGTYAGIADATYASGIAATGGSVALRIVGAASAIDAVGWGTAASSWLEGGVAAAPAAGSSLERLPGGAGGSTQDTDDNAADFVVRAIPGPENSASPPVPGPIPSGSPEPSATPAASSTSSPSVPPAPSPSPTPLPSVTPAPTATSTPAAEVVSIAAARSLPDGTRVTVEGVALTGSTFVDGGGYLADASGGLAVLLSDGSFARGERFRVTGSIDDRYAQRTLRASGGDVTVLASGASPEPLAVATGAVGEGVEGRLVRVAGVVVGGPTALSAGLAFELDDGSGPVRLLVGPSTGIDVTTWDTGFVVDAVGVVGQRDASGTGTTGYRVQPRDPGDLLTVGPGPSPTASPGASSTPDASPEPSQAPDIVSVAAARQLPKGASAVVRGVVTIAPGIVDPTTAVVQDATGAIVLRIGEEVGRVARGTIVEVRGVRATLSGMETLRVSTPPRSLGASAEPAPRAVRTAEAGESLEATLVVVRGGLVGAPRRSSAGTVSFEIDDGSGPLRISIGSSAGIDATALAGGTWIEVRGVLGQETTGSLPLRGYRVWPRDGSDLRVVAAATSGTERGEASTGGEGSGESSGIPLGSLDTIGGSGGAGLPIGATLVVGPWEELGVGGMLWDGDRLVALHADMGPLAAAVLGGGQPPMALQANGLEVVGVDDSTSIPLVRLPDEPGALVPSGLPPSPPLGAPHLERGEARWVALLGRLVARSDAPALLVDGVSVAIDRRCDGEPMPQRATVSVTGVLVGAPPRLVVPCGGITPAPLLARLTSVEAPPSPPLPHPTTTAARQDPSPGPLGAVLLLFAATILAGGAGLARRALRGAAPPPDTEDGAPGDGEEADGSASPPALALVPLPRERAP